MPDRLPQPFWANANRVTNFLMVGGSLRSGQADPATVLRELTGHGVTHILDCRSEASDAALVREHAPGIVYARTGTEDNAPGTEEGWFDRGVGFARDALSADPQAVILTHCALGQTRGPSMGFAVLLDQGVPAGEALRLITSVRPQARVGYAEWALDWHLDRIGASERERSVARQDLHLARRERFSHHHHGWR